MKNIYIILIIVFILILILLSNKNEYYNVIKADSDNKTFSSKLAQKGVRQNSDALDGMLFEDVNLYESEHVVDGELGLEKCIKNCKGMCVEFGMTGDAYCFPYDYADISNKYTETIKSQMGFRPY
jgi:hypothetical protein